MPECFVAGSAQIGNTCPRCERRTLIIEALVCVDSTIKGKVKGQSKVEVDVTLDREKSKLGARCVDCGWTGDGTI